MIVNYINSPKKIVNSFYQDDGTTLGKKVYIDDIGGHWINANFSDINSTLNNTRMVNSKGEFVQSTKASIES